MPRRAIGMECMTWPRISPCVIRSTRSLISGGISAPGLPPGLPPFLVEHFEAAELVPALARLVCARTFVPVLITRFVAPEFVPAAAGCGAEWFVVEDAWSAGSGTLRASFVLP